MIHKTVSQITYWIVNLVCNGNIVFSSIFPDGNASDFAGLFLLKDSRIVITTSLWNSNILFFCFCTVRKRFHAFSIEALTAHVKTGHHHFFDLMRTLYVDTNWSNRSTSPIFACCSPQKVSALVHQLVSWLTLTTIELCWQDYR